MENLDVYAALHVSCRCRWHVRGNISWEPVNLIATLLREIFNIWTHTQVCIMRYELLILSYWSLIIHKSALPIILEQISYQSATICRYIPNWMIATGMSELQIYHQPWMLPSLLSWTPWACPRVWKLRLVLLWRYCTFIVE